MGQLDLGTVIFILLSPAAVAAATIALLRKWSEKKIDLHFEQRMEQFKHGLAQAAAAAEFDYQRKLHDFQKYSEKRHAAYIDIFKHATLLSTTLTTLSGRTESMKEVLNSNHDGLRIDNLLSSYGLPAELVTRLRDGYFEAKARSDNDPAATALSSVAVYLTRDGYSHLNEFTEVVSDNALYVTHTVERQANQLILIASHALVAIPNSTFRPRYEEPFEELKKAIKQELSIGDYEIPPEQKVLEAKRDEMARLF